MEGGSNVALVGRKALEGCVVVQVRIGQSACHQQCVNPVGSVTVSDGYVQSVDAKLKILRSGSAYARSGFGCIGAYRYRFGVNGEEIIERLRIKFRI